MKYLFACCQCQYKAATKDVLNIYNSNLHWEMKYMCYICGHQTDRPVRELSKGIRRQNMKGRSTHVRNVTTRQLRRVTLLNTSKRYMKERDTHAGNVITRQLQRVASINTSERYMEERDNLNIEILQYCNIEILRY